MFDRGVIHVVVGYIVYHYYLLYDRAVIDVVVGYNVYHNCFWLDRAVVHVVVAILSSITLLCLREKWFLLLLLYCLPLLFKV
jgi:hypothetical protein